MKRLLFIIFLFAGIAAHGQITAAYHGSYYVAAAPSGDPDANAYIAAVTGGGDVLSSTEQGAITQFVTDLKTAGVWTKKSAIWLMVGSTASAHKWNLKDPRDLDAAYRLTWSGTLSHSSNGVQFSSGYGDTHLNPSLVLTAYSTSMSFWSRTSGNVNGVEIGCSDPNMELAIAYAGTLYSRTYDAPNSIVVVNAGGPAGYYEQVVQSSSYSAVYYNGSLFASASTANTSALTNQTIAIGRDGAGTTTNLYTTRECAGATVGAGLTSTEALAEYNAWATFNSTLAR